MEPRPGRGPEPQEEETMFGMKLSSFTEDVFDEVVSLYEQVAGVRMREWDDWPIDRRIHTTDIHEELLNGESEIQRRFGSRYTPDSKLWIRTADIFDRTPHRIITFDFDLNMSNQAERAERMKSEFQKRITQYLQQKKLAVPIKK